MFICFCSRRSRTLFPSHSWGSFYICSCKCVQPSWLQIQRPLNSLTSVANLLLCHPHPHSVISTSSSSPYPDLCAAEIFFSNTILCHFIGHSMRFIAFFFYPHLILSGIFLFLRVLMPHDSFHDPCSV